MHIVSQSASFSYSLFPPFPLLSAPPKRDLLTTPKIAGLLLAKTGSPKIEVIFTPSRAELLKQIGPIRSREEMDAELEEIALKALRFYDEMRQRRAKERPQ